MQHLQATQMKIVHAGSTLLFYVKPIQQRIYNCRNDAISIFKIRVQSCKIGWSIELAPHEQKQSCFRRNRFDEAIYNCKNIVSIFKWHLQACK